MARVPMKNIAAQSLLEEGVSHAGFAVKEGGRLKSMQTRYFILREGCLYYYKDFKSTKEQNAFCITGYEVKEDLSQDGVYGIRLIPGAAKKKSFYFVLPSDDERKVWVEKLSQEMGRIAGDGCEVASNTPESYDYCYQRGKPAIEEQQHDYEETDNIETMQSPRQAVPNQYSQKGERDDPRGKSLPARPPVPTTSPPACPPRVNRLPGLGVKPSPFLPKPKKAPAPQPPGRSQVVGANQNSKPLPPRGPKPSIDQKPLVSQKPVRNNFAMTMTEEIYVQKKASADELAKKLKQRGPNVPGRYEVQKISTEDDGSDSSDTGSYLDLDEDETIPRIARGKPSGSSAKKNQPPTLETEEKLLPPSVFQDSLSRDTAECILNSIQEPGMYLIRLGRTGLQVITVFVEDSCKHYQIFEKNASLYLKDNEPSFSTLVELIRHYMKNDLPTCSSRLMKPYS